jgi:hypothetical protein
MKSPKEIKLAALNFMRISSNYEMDQQEGLFIPFAPKDYLKEQRTLLLAALSFGIIGLYLAINALHVDAVYYWHIDIVVIVGLLTISIYFVLFFKLLSSYLTFNKVLKEFDKDPKKCPFGVLITPQYYFENTPKSYHIVARENIVKIDYEENKNEGYYLELLIDNGEDYTLQGFHFDPSVFDLKAWVQTGKISR